MSCSGYSTAPSLKYCGRDATKVYHTFCSAAGLDMNSDDIVFLQDPTAAAVHEAVTRFVAPPTDGARLFFYFAGHAYEFNGLNILQPVTHEIDDETDVCLQDMRLNLGNGSLLFAVVHACRSTESPGMRPPPMVRPRALAPRTVLRTDWLFLFSCLSSEPTFDDSPFAEHLCDLLPFPGLPVESLLRLLKARMPRNRVETHISLRDELCITPPAPLLSKCASAFAMLALWSPIVVPMYFQDTVPERLQNRLCTLKHEYQATLTSTGDVVDLFINCRNKSEVLILHSYLDTSAAAFDMERLCFLTLWFIALLVVLWDGVRLWCRNSLDANIWGLWIGTCAATITRFVCQADVAACQVQLLFHGRTQYYLSQHGHDILRQFGNIGFQFISTCIVLWWVSVLQSPMKDMSTCMVTSFGVIFVVECSRWCSSAGSEEFFYDMYVCSGLLMMIFSGWAAMKQNRSLVSCTQSQWQVMRIHCGAMIIVQSIWFLEVFSWIALPLQEVANLEDVMLDIMVVCEFFKVFLAHRILASEAWKRYLIPQDLQGSLLTDGQIREGTY